MKKPLSRSQAICLILLWIALCYIVIITSAQIDGPVILSIIISGALVMIPLYKAHKRRIK